MEETAGQRTAADRADPVKLVARAITDAVDEVADDVAQYTIEQVADLGGSSDPEPYELTYAVARANIGSMAAMLEYGVPPEGIEPPAEAVEFAVGMLRRGVELAAILRAYRVGHRRLSRIWMERVGELIEDPEIRADVVDRTSDFLFAWIDVTAEGLVKQYAEERERWLRGATAVRMETARAIVEGGKIDIDVASGRLRYELRRRHRALIGWVPPGAEDSSGSLELLEREGGALARKLSDSEPLVMPAGRGVVWIWVGSFSARAESEVEVSNEAEASFALGEWCEGIDGFRTSHEQAERAHRLALMAGARSKLVRYRDVALASALCADPEQARAFASAELGALAGSDPTAERLRETLTAYLEMGASPLHAAERLGVHAKTVAYRVRRAEELLGHTVTARRRELEAALLVYATLDR